MTKKKKIVRRKKPFMPFWVKTVMVVFVTLAVISVYRIVQDFLGSSWRVFFVSVFVLVVISVIYGFKAVKFRAKKQFN
jgi:hypothetical protein